VRNNFRTWRVLHLPGPLGNGLVPFEKTADAIAFFKDHKCKNVLRFDDLSGFSESHGITPAMVTA